MKKYDVYTIEKYYNNDVWINDCVSAKGPPRSFWSSSSSQQHSHTHYYYFCTAFYGRVIFLHTRFYFFIRVLTHIKNRSRQKNFV